MLKKIFSLVLTILLCVVMLPDIKSYAANNYTAIDISANAKKTRVSMRKASGDCAIAAIACLEAYKYNITGNSKTVYDAVRAQNGGGDSINWSKVGYVNYGLNADYSNNNANFLKAIYDELASGRPVIVKRKRTNGKAHYSVCVAYHGSSSTLEESGFTVMDTYGSSSYMYTNMASWANGNDKNVSGIVNEYAVRTTGIKAISSSTQSETPPLSPSKPQNLIVVKESDNTAKISWSAGSNATAYEAQYYSRDSKTWKSDTDYKSKTALSYATSGLSRYDSYDFRVRSVNAAGKSDWVAVTYTKNATATKTYTITYNANGGSGAPANQTKPADQSIILSSVMPTRTGYTFAGWGVEKNSSYPSYMPGETFNYNGDMSLYAVWKALPAETGTVNIQYNANGGTGAPASHSVIKDSSGGATFNISTMKPSRSGYTFLGWRLDNSTAYGIDSPGQSIAIDLGIPTSNTTLTYYAQWETAPDSTSTPEPVKTYTITFDANGGIGAPPKQTIEYNQSISSVVPTQNGYTFKGWGTEKNSIYPSWIQGESFRFTQDLYLYAIWETSANGTVTIRYDSDGGTGTPPSHTAKKDGNGKATFTLSSVEPTKSGYKFLGWAVQKGSVIGNYFAGQTITVSVGNVNADTTLTYYAQWAKLLPGIN